MDSDMNICNENDCKILFFELTIRSCWSSRELRIVNKATI